MKPSRSNPNGVVQQSPGLAQRQPWALFHNRVAVEAAQYLGSPPLSLTPKGSAAPCPHIGASASDPLRRRGACSARASFWVLAALGSVAMMAVLAALLFWLSRNPQGSTVVTRKPLVLFCAAGLKPPVEAVARRYERTYGVPVQIQYGGSGTLLSNIRVSHLGDLFLAADESYIRSARELGLVAETIPLAIQRPVIVVRRGNPKHIHTLEELQLGGTRFALANPDAASIGRTVRALLSHTGQWAEFERKVAVFKPTVNEVANDVKLGSVDAGIVWDATAQQYPELEAVHLPLFDAAPETISIGVLRESGQPSAALRFARLSRRSGCVPAEPYPPLRYFQAIEDAATAVCDIYPRVGK